MNGTEDEAIGELKALIDKTLSGSRVPRDTRNRLSTAVEHAMRSNLEVTRRYLLALSGDDRANTMMQLYREGLTLEEIGERFDLSRERVRQILTIHFGEYRSLVAEDRRFVRDAQRDERREQARRVWEDEHAADVERLFAQGFSDEAIAKATDASVRFISNYRSINGMVRQRGVTWSDEDIFDALRQAAKDVPEGLTPTRYVAWRESLPSEEREKVPSSATLGFRFPSFGEACELAGLQATGRTNTKRRSDYVEESVAWDFLREYFKWSKKKNLSPTTRNFELFREEHPDAPSVSIMVRRLGGFREAVQSLIEGE